MIKIDYPPPGFKVKKEEGKDRIFDPVRRRWLILTPEEWVRQNFVQYLIQVKKYPVSLVAMEKELKLGELSKRFDILVYNKEHEPWMMIECKSQQVPVDKKVLEQLLRYHISVPVSYLVITNGDYCYGWSKEAGALKEIQELPEIG